MTYNGIPDRDEAGSLPIQDGLDISRLSAVFRHTNTSYKFLWALALLRFCSGVDQISGKISLRNLASGMLDSAPPFLCVSTEIAQGRQDSGTF